MEYYIASNVNGNFALILTLDTLIKCTLQCKMYANTVQLIKIQQKCDGIQTLLNNEAVLMNCTARHLSRYREKFMHTHTA